MPGGDQSVRGVSGPDTLRIIASADSDLRYVAIRNPQMHAETSRFNAVRERQFRADRIGGALHDRKTQAGAAGRMRIQPVEALQRAGAIFRRDPGSVLRGNQHARPGPARAGLCGRPFRLVTFFTGTEVGIGEVYLSGPPARF
jgi:hypothetical protein